MWFKNERHTAHFEFSPWLASRPPRCPIDKYGSQKWREIYQMLTHLAGVVLVFELALLSLKVKRLCGP